MREEINNNPDLVYTDRSGRRNPEYISLGCDSMPVLKGRSPLQVYANYMRSFRGRFQDYLGSVIVVSNTIHKPSNIDTDKGYKYHNTINFS